MTEIPQPVAVCLTDALGGTGAHFDSAGILAFFACDRSLAAGFQTTWLLFDRKNLYILSAKGPAPASEFRGYFSRKAGRTPQAVKPEASTLRTVPLDKIEGLKIENLATTGMVVLQTAGREEMLALFSAGCMHDAARFAERLEKFRGDGTLPSDAPEAEDEDEACPKCGMLYPERGRKVCPRCEKKGSVFLRLLRLSFQYKSSIALIVFFMILNSAFGLAGPYLQGHVLFDWAIADKNAYFGRVLVTISLMFACQALGVLAGVGFGTINARLAARVMRNIKVDVFSAMQRLSLSFFQKRETGQLMTRVNNDSADVQNFFIDGIPYFAVNGLNIVGILTMMLLLNWKLTLLCMIPVPLLIFFVFRAFPKLYRLNWFKFVRRSRMTSLISDSFRGRNVVKAFGKGDAEVSRFTGTNDSFFRAESAQQKMVGTIFPLMSLLMQVGGYVIWVYGGLQVMSGLFTFGTLMTFLNYIFMIYGPIQYLCNVSDWWSYCMSAAQRIFEITDAQPEVRERPNARHLPTLRGDIAIDGVTFGYQPNKPVLKNVSMDVRAGMMVGVVGHSGAGKSTLVNLVTRLYDVTDGAIRIDGVDVRDIKTADLRRNIGIVSQEIYVFIGTIAENIAYARPGCPLSEVVRAAKIANAHDFIERLPDGYDTLVGTGGHDLSGGEKQRISIARAILQDPRILILDEATASLDTQTERRIQEGLETLIRGRTTIAIAHRLSTLRNADFLVVLENGELRESGTHDELVRRQGIYFNLFKKQNEALSLTALEE